MAKTFLIVFGLCLLFSIGQSADQKAAVSVGAATPAESTAQNTDLKASSSFGLGYGLQAPVYGYGGYGYPIPAYGGHPGYGYGGIGKLGYGYGFAVPHYSGYGYSPFGYKGYGGYGGYGYPGYPYYG